MDLKERSVLVTGGTMGLGAAIAIELARRGANVAIAARNLGSPAEEVKAAIVAAGRRCLLIAADFTKPEDCGRAVAATAAEFGRLDVLVHNAGGPSPGKIDDVTPDQWRQTMDLHVNANFYLVRAALPYLRKNREGCIITVSSTAGILGVPGAIAYATAKRSIPQ